jgi:hypothetical protein
MRIFNYLKSNPMRQTLLICTAFLMGAQANAQDWRPMRSGIVYNYLINQDMNSVRSLWIDSTKSVNGETVDFLNRVYTFPVIATLSDGSFCDQCAVVNQPQFLLRSMRETGDGYVFEDEDYSFLLKPDAQANDSWTFDNTNRTATVTDISEGPVMSAVDSLKTITLSTGEKITLSKLYGIVSFPILGSQDKYEIAGLEGTGIGIRIPDFDSIYSFAPGDKFEYHGTQSGSSQKVYTFIDQYKIISRKDENNQVKYLIEGIFQELDRQPYKYTKTLIFERKATWLNAYPYQFIDQGSDVSQWVDIKYDPDLKMYVKTISTGDFYKPYMERFGNTDTFRKAESAADGIGETILAPNLGNIYEEDVSVSWSSELKLVAHSGAVANFGTFTKFNNVSTGQQINRGPQIQLNSNPVSDKLIVSYRINSTGPAEMTLCNAAGVIVLRHSCAGTAQTAEMDVSKLAAGMYFLTFRSAEGIRQEKVVVQR